VMGNTLDGLAEGVQGNDPLTPLWAWVAQAPMCRKGVRANALRRDRGTASWRV
jgi:hypothetical protein